MTVVGSTQFASRFVLGRGSHCVWASLRHNGEAQHTEWPSTRTPPLPSFLLFPSPKHLPPANPFSSFVYSYHGSPLSFLCPSTLCHLIFSMPLRPFHFPPTFIILLPVIVLPFLSCLSLYFPSTYSHTPCRCFIFPPCFSLYALPFATPGLLTAPAPLPADGLSFLLTTLAYPVPAYYFSLLPIAIPVPPCYPTPCLLPCHLPLHTYSPLSLSSIVCAPNTNHLSPFPVTLSLSCLITNDTPSHTLPSSTTYPFLFL